MRGQELLWGLLTMRMMMLVLMVLMLVVTITMMAVLVLEAVMAIIIMNDFVQLGNSHSIALQLQQQENPGRQAQPRNSRAAFL